MVVESTNHRRQIMKEKGLFAFTKGDSALKPKDPKVSYKQKLEANKKIVATNMKKLAAQGASLKK